MPNSLRVTPGLTEAVGIPLRDGRTCTHITIPDEQYERTDGTPFGFPLAPAPKEQRGAGGTQGRPR